MCDTSDKSCLAPSQTITLTCDAADQARLKELGKKPWIIRSKQSQTP